MFRTLIACSVLILAHLVVVNQAGAQTKEATTCSAAAVQAAIDSAVSGSTILIPAGTCSWATIVSIPNTKSITLKGAGIGQTVIKDGSSMPILHVVASATQFTRVTGLTLDANGVTKQGSNGSILVTGSGADAFRIDGIHFQNVRERAIKVAQGGDELTGLIDHNVFDCPFRANCQSVQITGAGPQQSGHMGRPYRPGSNGYIYVEDNIFNYAYQNDGGVEGYGGARYVLRFNVLHGVTQGHHGADSGNYRGTQAFEIYHNTFDHPPTFLGDSNVRALSFRSGTGFVFNNSFSPTYKVISMDNYRSRNAVSGTVWGDCDGSHPFDGNKPGRVSGSGWPCLDQIGWFFTDKLDGTSTLTPFYAFLNRKGGVQYDALTVGELRVPFDVMENREFYNEDPLFNGTKGAGVGPLDSRPSSCTIGVGYWATDQGEWNSTNGSGRDGQFYKCTSTNSWTLYYTPYSYPHPLQFGPPLRGTSSSGPASPTNLRVVSR